MLVDRGTHVPHHMLGTYASATATGSAAAHARIMMAIMIACWKLMPVLKSIASHTKKQALQRMLETCGFVLQHGHGNHDCIGDANTTVCHQQQIMSNIVKCNVLQHNAKQQQQQRQQQHAYCKCPSTLQKSTRFAIFGSMAKHCAEYVAMCYSTSPNTM